MNKVDQAPQSTNNDLSKGVRKYINIPAYWSLIKLQRIPSHQISYLEWGGSSSNNVVVCVHGLTRNAHDFDDIGSALAKGFRIIAIDMPGRGNSDWFTNKNHYNYHTYIKDILFLIKTLGLTSVYWIGTSMGGLVGMCLATYYPKTIKAMVLNDIGPEIPNRTLDRIRKYTNQEVVFNSFDEGEQFMKVIFKYCGIKDEENWKRIALTSLVKGTDGKYRMNYDSGVSEKATKIHRPEMLNLWYLWKKVRCPVLLIHGAKSDILLSSTIEKMRAYRDFDLHIVDDSGHAPALIYTKDIQKIVEWIEVN